MLTENDRRLLRATGRHHRDAGEELAAVTSTGLSLVRGWQRVNELLDDPAAWEVEPEALLVLHHRRGSRVRFRGVTTSG